MPRTGRKFLLVVGGVFLVAAAAFGGFFRSSTTPPAKFHASHPSCEMPDNIVLSPVADMAGGMAVTWRTSAAVSCGVVQYAEENGRITEKKAVATALTAKELWEDGTVHCFSAAMEGLRPATRYRYRVGSGQPGQWSAYRSFVTAGRGGDDFTFVYLGDTQVEHDRLGRMLDVIESTHPETLFYMIGGDLVDRGERRNEWDAFMAGSKGWFSLKPLAPTPGNHDYDGLKSQGQKTYRSYFSPPANGPEKLPSGLTYSFVCNNVKFIVLDSNRPAGRQCAWLEKELKQADVSGVDFKVVMFHHPVHNLRRGRSNPAAKLFWVPLFERHRVDLVLNGHDHAYMRSKKIRRGKPAKPGEFGVTYVVANACGKYYKSVASPVAARQLSEIATYQKIAVTTNGDGVRELRYEARDEEGNLVDEFVTTARDKNGGKS